MKWTSAFHCSPSIEKSIRAVAEQTQNHLKTNQPDLGFLFVSSAYRNQMIDLWPHLKKDLNVHHLIGCTGGGIIGDGKEEEEALAVSFMAGVLPDVTIRPFHLTQKQLPTPDASPRAWQDVFAVTPQEKPTFVLLSDPFSIEPDDVLDGLDYAYPNAIKTGGLASGGTQPGENLLFCEDKILPHGMVGLSLTGNISVESIVAQGCRPIGEPLAITGADGNVLLSINNQPPLAYLQELYGRLTPQDQDLLQTSLFVGISMDAYNTDPKQGDFLIRNIIGLDQKKGFLAVGAEIRKGQLIQFHLRDAKTSHDDLEFMLSQSESAKRKPSAPGNPSVMSSLLFSCMGRGRRLYSEENHDSSLIKSMVGDIALGGFFCNGEIGPVQGKSYIHGYTSSIAVFSPKKEE